MVHETPGDRGICVIAWTRNLTLPTTWGRCAKYMVMACNLHGDGMPKTWSWYARSMAMVGRTPPGGDRWHLVR